MASSLRALLTGVGLTLAVGLVWCSPFRSDTGAGAGAGAPDAAPDVDTPDDPTPDAGSEASAPARTGVACGAGDARCAVGEKCCWDEAGTVKVCAVNCSSVDAGARIYECGQPSDCPLASQLCCMFLNDCSSNSPIFGSACRAPDNCSVCGGALGGAGIGCDPSRSDECPPDQHCNGTFDRYSFCAR